ncbi:hypothetical protein [Pacificispira sp.]|uniref:hypothetical protein n=1 Tax=Pacificispira sp. TaxID=2888761 RepID=UPI003BAB38A3
MIYQHGEDFLNTDSSELVGRVCYSHPKGQRVLELHTDTQGRFWKVDIGQAKGKPYHEAELLTLNQFAYYVTKWFSHTGVREDEYRIEVMEADMVETLIEAAPHLGANISSESMQKVALMYDLHHAE